MEYCDKGTLVVRHFLAVLTCAVQGLAVVIMEYCDKGTLVVRHLLAVLTCPVLCKALLL